MLLVGKQFIEEKHRLFEEQKGVCPLCGRALNPDVLSNHLDHDHSLEGPNAGRVRSLLCIFCNATEGQLKHKFDSSGLVSRGVDYVAWLKELIAYYEKDYSTSAIHPVYVNDMSKAFARMNKPEMIDELSRVGVTEPGKTKATMIASYKKALRNFLKGVKCK